MKDKAIGQRHKRARQGKARPDKTTQAQGKTRQAEQNKTSSDKTKQNKPKENTTRQGKTRHGKTRQEKTREDKGKEGKRRKEYVACSHFFLKRLNGRLRHFPVGFATPGVGEEGSHLAQKAPPKLESKRGPKNKLKTKPPLHAPLERSWPHRWASW